VRGVTPTEIVVGMASPFSGTNKELGRAMKAGIETAFAAANEAGGVHGRRLRLVALDDGYEPSRTGEVMKRLVEVEGVFAVVGNVGTPTAAVSIPYCQEKKVVFFGALSGADLLRKSPPDRYVFNFRPSYPEETSAAVRYLVDVRRVDPGRVAIFHQADAFGESGMRGAMRELEGRGADPRRVLKVTYVRNTADVGAAVGAVRDRAGEIDAIIMVATYKAAATFIRKVRDAGLDPIFTNVSPVDSNELSAELVGSGPRYAEDVVVTQVVPLPTSRSTAVMRYQQALARHAVGERPGFLTLEGWIVGNVFLEGLRRAGPDPDTEKLVNALEGIKDLDLGIGTRITFAGNEHQGSHKIWGTALQPDGSYAQIDLE
jgi:ABC-type branched-subunit amino acid transport system substrate-binding protein